MPEGRSIIDEVDPATAYSLLESDPEAVLIDVRTQAEWAFVGVPNTASLDRDLWTIEWIRFQDMAPNPAFLDQIATKINSRIDGGPAPRMFFICRSGQRSMAAANAVASALAERGEAVHCTNVAEGFEGNLDAEGHRGTTNGWKARGLPWRQN